MPSPAKRRRRTIAEIIRSEARLMDSQEEEYELSSQEVEDAELAEAGFRKAHLRAKWALSYVL